MEIHILGNIQNQLNIGKNPSIICHGGYDRNDFPKIVETLSPDIGLVLSIWPDILPYTYGIVDVSSSVWHKPWCCG